MTDQKKPIKSTRVVLPIGSSSLIVVFIVLCMAIFTAITYVTAANEQKLNNHTTKFLSRYYLANEQAARVLSDLQVKLDENTPPELLMNYEKHPIAVNGSYLDFDVPIDDSLIIRVRAEIRDNHKLDVQSYSLYNLNADMVIEDEFLDLFEGDGSFEGFADNFENSGG